MTTVNSNERLNSWSQTTYLIEVDGPLSKSAAGMFAGMRITTWERKDHSIVTSLTGSVMDQSELSGMLNFLAELALPILKVEHLGKK